MKHTRLLLLLCGLWVVQCQLCAVASSEKISEIAFEEMLPEDTIFYLSVPNASKLVANFKETNCYKILLEIDPIGLTEGQPEFERAKKLYNTFVQPLTKVFHGRIGLAVKNIPPGPGIPGMIFLADVDENEQILRAYLKERIGPLLSQIGAQTLTFTHGDYEVQQFSLPKPVPFAACYTVADGVFIATVGRQTIEEILDLTARPRSLADSELFREVREKVGEKSDFLVYANTAALLESVQPVIPEEVKAILQVLGLTSIKALGTGAEPMGTASKGVWYMATGPERTGVLGLIARKSPPLKAVSYLPEDVTFLYALSLGDFGQFYDELLDALRQTVVSLKGNRAWEQILAGLRRAESKAGFRIREDLLAPFGGELCIAVKVPEVLGFPPVFLLIETKDAEKAKALIDRLIAALEKASGGPVVRTTQEYKGIGITSVSLMPGGGGMGVSLAALPFVRPAFGVVGDFLVIGVHSNSVKKIVDVHRGGKSLKDNPDFQRVFANLAPQGSVTSYVNLRDVYDFAYGTFGAIAAAQIGPEMVGKLGRISQYFGSAASRLSCDDKGIMSESFSDSGGAEQILIQVALMGLVPRFVGARQKAQAVGCTHNLRQLAMACMMYAEDHDGVLPAKLSDLYPDYVGNTTSVFVCPVHKGKEISVEDIDAKSDYELKIPGAKLGEINDPARTIMILEKEPNHRGGRNAAYADGHVERGVNVNVEQPAAGGVLKGGVSLIRHLYRHRGHGH